MGIWSMATRVIVAGRTTSLPAWSVIVRVDDASGVVVCDWAVEPKLPAQAVRARAAVGQDRGQCGEACLHCVLSHVRDYEGDTTQN